MIERFWNDFLRDTNRGCHTEYVSCFHFELTEHLANELLGLVISGQKRATSSSLWTYEIEGERLPRKGDYNIVTDWEGNPRCVIETVNVTLIPFKEMTYEICQREGEDKDLESWRKGHIHFFTEEGKQLGYVFTEEMPVVFEDFKVVYIK